MNCPYGCERIVVAFVLSSLSVMNLFFARKIRKLQKSPVNSSPIYSSIGIYVSCSYALEIALPFI